jgi:hypothetical protein
MGRKPVLGLAGLFLAGVTMTGCECTDWCCFGDSKTTTTPPARPAPDWSTRPTNQTQPTAPTQTSSSGANRFSTPTTQPAIQPVSAPESTVTAPRDNFQGSPVGTPSGAGGPGAPSAPEMSVPAAPSADQRPVPTAPVEDTSMSPPPAVPRSTSTGVRIAPPMDPVATPPSQQLPPLDKPAATTTPAVPPPPSMDDTVPPAPTPVNGGTTKSSSKYQSDGPNLEVAPPPPPPGVPPMPGAGPNGN